MPDYLRGKSKDWRLVCHRKVDPPFGPLDFCRGDVAPAAPYADGRVPVGEMGIAPTAPCIGNRGPAREIGGGHAYRREGWRSRIYIGYISNLPSYLIHKNSK
jgi:hypothetical protein